MYQILSSNLMAEAPYRALLPSLMVAPRSPVTFTSEDHFPWDPSLEVRVFPSEQVSRTALRAESRWGLSLKVSVLVFTELTKWPMEQKAQSPHVPPSVFPSLIIIFLSSGSSAKKKSYYPYSDGFMQYVPLVASIS